MTPSDAADAELATAMLTGWIFSGLQGLEDVMTPPITWGKIEADGHIELMLASGMTVTVTVRVDPVL